MRMADTSFFFTNFPDQSAIYEEFFKGGEESWMFSSLENSMPGSGGSAL